MNARLTALLFKRKDTSRNHLVIVDVDDINTGFYAGCMNFCTQVAERPRCDNNQIHTHNGLEQGILVKCVECPALEP